jgi:Ca2+-binding RTX toxin-like protein
VRIRKGRFLVGGFNVVSGRGGGGFIGPYRRSLFAVGTPGDDRLSGGPKRDYLIGRGGHDTMHGGGGEDFLRARDKTRDVVRCGRGADIAKVDRVDRLRRCEDVRTRRSSSD